MGIWSSGASPPIQKKKLLSENPIEVGSALSFGFLVIMKTRRAAIRTAATATMTPVVRRGTCFFTIGPAVRVPVMMLPF
jgi:hypothetical protein